VSFSDGPRPARRVRPGEEGFSILEVALSLVVLLTVLVAVSSLLSTASKVGTDSRLKTEAIGIATSALDAQVETGAATLLTEVGDASLGTQSPAAGPGTFTLEREVAPYVPGSSACVSPASNSEALLKVTVWATWAPAKSGSQWWVAGASGSTSNLVSVSSLLSLPATSFNANDGSILVKVLGAEGEDEQGVTVTATLNGTSLSPVSTTTSGCALFTNVTPGTWTLNVSRSGWIDSQDDWNSSTNNAVAPSQSQVVSAGATTTFSFAYDQAATVTAQYSLSQGTLPPNLNLPLSFYSANLTSSPYVTCGSESNPDSATPAGSVDGQPVTLSEGGSATVTIPLTPVNVAVTYNATAVSGATVTASVPTGDANCPSAGSPTAMPTIDFGPTGAVLNAAYSGPVRHGLLTAAVRPRHRTRLRARPHATLTGWGGPSCQANVSLGTSPNPSTSGQSVTLTSTVTNAGNPFSCWFFSGNPTGTVTFSDGGTTIGSSALNGSGTATFTTSTLPVGSDVITASYSGDSRYLSATSSSVTQVVTGGTTTTTTTSTTTTTTTTAPTTTTTTTPSGGTVGVASGLPDGKFVLSATYTVGTTTYTSKSPPTVVIKAGGVYLNGSSTPLSSGSIITVAVS
jgi:hypothetical protein